MVFLSHQKRSECSWKKQIKRRKRCHDNTCCYRTMYLMMPDFGFNQRTFLQPRTAIQSRKTLYLQDLLIQGSICYHKSARVLLAWWSSSLQNPHILIWVKACSSKNIFLEEVKTVIIHQLNIKHGYVSQACMLILQGQKAIKQDAVLPWAICGNRRSSWFSIMMSQIPGVHLWLAFQCECRVDLSKGHMSSLPIEKEMTTKKKQNKTSKTQRDTPAASNCGTVHFLKRIYNISKYYIYIYFQWYKVTVDPN